MIQQFGRVGSIFLVTSLYLSAMEKPSLKELAIKRIAALATHDMSYCGKVLDSLPRELNAFVIQQIIATNEPKGALPIVLLSYKLHQQQHQNNTNQHIVRLLLSNNQQLQLTPEQSDQLIQNSATISNLIQDLEEQSQEIPLPLLTQEQVTVLLPYISIFNKIHAINTTLSAIERKKPEMIALSSYWIRYTALQQLKEYLTACTIPTLCDLLITASYLDIQASDHTTSFIELATQALGDKLLQSPQYQDEYNVINTLPEVVQNMLVRYLVCASKIRSIFCGNSTDVITNTAQILPGHTGHVISVSWSPDGKYIASCSQDKTLKVWNAAIGDCIHTLKGHTLWINSISWSPDGKQLVSSSDDKTIKVWDVTTGTCMHTLEGHTDQVKSIAWSPDGSIIASGSYGEIKAWNAITGVCINTEGYTNTVFSVSWSPNGRYIAIGSTDETVRIGDTCAGICIHTLQGHTDAVKSVSWSPNNRYIASCSDDKTIKVWDNTTGACIHTLEGHTNRVHSVSWSPDGSMIASGSNDKTIRIWNAYYWCLLYTLQGNIGNINSVAWSPDSTQLAVGGLKITMIYNILNKELDNSLNKLSWEQTLLLIRIVNAYTNKQDIDFAQDTRSQQCYNSLSQQVKQLIDPLL